MEPLASLEIDSTSASVVMLQTSENLTFLIFASCSTNLPSHLSSSLPPHSPGAGFCGKIEGKKNDYERKLLEVTEGERPFWNNKEQYEEVRESGFSRK